MSSSIIFARICRMVVAGIILCLAAVYPALSQEYSGEGTAVLGSAMTPEATKQLAFEKARKEALQKFGTYVVSEENLQTIDTAEGVEEIGQKRIVAMAAGKATLVEGSKDIRKEMSGQAIVYDVEAAFRVEDSEMEEAIQSYLERSKESQYSQSVSEAVRMQEKIAELDPNSADSDEVNSLVKNTREAYQEVSMGVQGLDGQKLEAKIDDRHAQRKKAFVRYLQVIKEYGRPRDMVKFDIPAPRVEDEGYRSEVTYNITASPTQNAKRVQRACEQTKPIWTGTKFRPDQTGYDSWIRRVFEEGLDVFELSMPILLYMIDDQGNVIAASTKTSEAIKSGSTFDFPYYTCDTSVDKRVWDGKWEVDVPNSILSEVEAVVVGPSGENLDEVVENGPFKESSENLVVNKEGKRAPLEDWLYSNYQFQGLIDMYIDKVKSLSRRTKKDLEQDDSIEKFFDQ